MHYVADLHLHSKYSRAVSKDMILPMMARMAQAKGLDILSAADWTHPMWFKEIRAQLTEAGDGIYTLKSQMEESELRRHKETLFVLSTEISCIYKDKGKLRRIHNLVFAPDFQTAEKINAALVAQGCNLTSDGRPIIGLSSKALLELVLSISEKAFLIPCHVWTPHFGLFGSASGYDSIEECFEELSSYIYGVETGLSSDPEMNWQMKELQNRSILSFSDAHSPLKMGREVTVMDLERPNFAAVKEAIMRKSQVNKIVYTTEFYPEEGKYHFSGHRNCNIILGPQEIQKDGSMCPVCSKRLTEGVMYRVQSLAGNYEQTACEKVNEHSLKWFTDRAQKHPPYVKLVPLLEIVAESLSMTVGSQKVKDMYYTVCQEFGSEMEVLLKTPIIELAKTHRRLSEGIEKVRLGNISINPGYDNVYGTVKIWEEEKRPDKAGEENKIQLELDL